jgi:two-component system alkaline phosphatase synthesis response regulator PhoP
MKNEAQCKKRTILIVDNYEENCKILSEILSSAYECYYTFDGTKVFSLVNEKKPDLIILDYKMFGIMGVDICKMVREHESTKNVPIIFISTAPTIDEKVRAFEQGADDFIPKPFNAQEFLLRIKARLHEKGKFLHAELQVGNMNMNIISRQVFVDGEEVRLTPKQFEVLRMLMSNKNKLVTREACMSEIWGDSKVVSRNMDAQISYLKRKIKKFQGKIIAVPTLGYRLEVLV